jgi:hypothetical protein
MLAKTSRLVAAAVAALFALRAQAHKVECEKEVGLVQLDAQGNVVLGEDGLPVFLSTPSTVLSIDTYPAAIGWRIHVDNLAAETSFVAGFEDPHLASATVQVFGTLPAPGVQIPVGGSIEAVVVERIASYEACAGIDVVVPLSGEGGPVCRDVLENVALVSTHADASGCRARLECKPPPQPLPETCRTVNGVSWCYHPQLCGTGCQAVCTALGMGLTISDADWFAAQDSLAECTQIATAFGLTSALVGSFVFACIEDTATSHDTGTLNGPLQCSLSPQCPALHRVGADGGTDCNASTSFMSLCPCSQVPPPNM